VTHTSVIIYKPNGEIFLDLENVAEHEVDKGVLTIRYRSKPDDEFFTVQKTSLPFSLKVQGARI
jgi:hypothetical protein